MTAEDFAVAADVSRETLRRLEIYLSMVERWQRAINLVGPKTLGDPWRRHILDSAQLMRYLPQHSSPLYDLGSGAGLPGLVLAIMGRSDVHLVESDQRKAQFLRQVIRALELPVQLVGRRIEALPCSVASIVTARALAPLPRLLDLAVPLLQKDGICLFLKGRNASDELTDARKSWSMSADLYPSLSDPSAVVLKLRDLARAPLHRQ